jgi:NAD(P)-dependent dehydrogenase (short-subunit alcohol dehydrogenase family)
MGNGGTDQYAFQDPRRQYPGPYDVVEEQDGGPGLQQRMTVKPDAGEETYRGSGRLTGRRAVVTGADSGIGRAVAIAFAREGADVVLSYLPEEEDDAREVVHLIEDAGRRGIASPGDLTDEATCVRLVDTAVDELGGIDLLANIAGTQRVRHSIDDLPTEQLERTFRTNVHAMFWLCRAAVRRMPPGSTILNTSSVQAYGPSPLLLDYASTKSAINAFTKSLAQQVASHGIRVNAIAPGAIWTPLQIATGVPSSWLRRFGATVPLGRAGQPAELAPAYVFLASAESGYVSGETLNVNGGWPTP